MRITLQQNARVFTGFQNSRRIKPKNFGLPALCAKKMIRKLKRGLQICPFGSSKC
ncbi:hypothetical protein HMPREF1249_1523 [Jonquetella sp. BV3C21]|nr:hypothetical protein HMPREF1249_1523 [Jonquetella sp. BV3C21]